MTILDHTFSQSGLHIVIENYPDIELNPEQTCEVLKMAGLIKNYKIYDGIAVVKFEYEDVFEEIRTTWLEWDEFVIFFEVDKEMVRELAEKYLLNKKLAA